MPDNTRYRSIDFIGGRILESREMLTLQNINEGIDTAGNIVVQDLNAIYREGATFNTVPTTDPSSTNITLTPFEPTKPMQVFVHGRWETIRPEDAPTVTMGSSLSLYLNWALNIITSVQDPSLVDGTTGEATANMGELDLSIGPVDTSSTALGPNQLAKNTVPIVLFQFVTNGVSLTVSPTDNVNTPAIATSWHAGLVRVTTDTAAGLVVSNDDPRMTGARTPLPLSVVDASVRVPVSNGNTNPDGSPQYDLNVDPGGISADKVIWRQGTTRISDFLSWINAQVSSEIATISAHIGGSLDLPNTHPMPSANQVGAAPLSHVNLPLGAAGSHPAVVNSDSGGFVVNQGTPNFPAGGAFQLTQNGVQICTIQHNGDFNSSFLNSLIFNPGGAGITFSGPLSTLYQLGQVVRDHVNQNSHANPHGLTAADIGAVAASSFGFSAGSRGFYALPGGFILQWCTGSVDNTNQTVNQSGTWPTPFPNSILSAFVSTNYINEDSTDSDIVMYQLLSSNNSSWTVRRARGGQYAALLESSPTLFAVGF